MNIIKQVCNELNITQRELSIKIDVSLPTIERWSWNNNKMPSIAKITLENKQVKSQLEAIKKAQETLKNI